MKPGAIKAEEKPCQAKRERKTYALTANPVIARAADPWQSSLGRRREWPFPPLTLSFQKTEPPPGLPRRFAPRNDGVGGKLHVLSSTLDCTL
ncbi:MAG: hypothetical protein LBU11_00340 [Zoogloeaceae bacterium]|jgi:hypothetical protein|nr:hypothetical protein [Zoogloeaceae bacterium]